MGRRSEPVEARWEGRVPPGAAELVVVKACLEGLVPPGAAVVVVPPPHGSDVLGQDQVEVARRPMTEERSALVEARLRQHVLPGVAAAVVAVVVSGLVDLEQQDLVAHQPAC